MELFAGGASIGWLGATFDQWCVVTGADAAVALAQHVYNDELYLRRADDPSRYLSLGDRLNYVEFYNWYGASGWALSGNVFTSRYSNAPLSYWSADDGYVYAPGWSGITALTVAFR